MKKRQREHYYATFKRQLNKESERHNKVQSITFDDNILHEYVAPNEHRRRMKKFRSQLIGIRFRSYKRAVSCPPGLLRINWNAWENNNEA